MLILDRLYCRERVLGFPKTEFWNRNGNQLSYWMSNNQPDVHPKGSRWDTFSSH